MGLDLRLKTIQSVCFICLMLKLAMTWQGFQGGGHAIACAGNRSFRQRVSSPTVSSPTTLVDSPTFLCHILCQFANVFKRSYDMFADNHIPVYQIKKISLVSRFDYKRTVTRWLCYPHMSLLKLFFVNNL